jgi:ComF family protein
MWSTLVDLLFPRTCAACGRPSERPFCAACAPLVEELPAWRCPRCADPLPPPPSTRAAMPGQPQLAPPPRCPACVRAPAPFSHVLVAWAHGGAVATAVHRLKYQGRREVAGALGGLIAARFAGELAAADLVAPVPLHPDRRRERGFDQALLLARGVARGAGVKLEPTLLSRTRRTRQQVGLPRAERRANVFGAFVARPCEGRRVVLVDDVLTTGATAASAAQAVLDAGAAGVRVLVVARAAS